jgi:6-phosphogluconate dehydrogenase
VDKILDTAGQKGAGKWTVINSADLGIPVTLIAEAVYARCISAVKEERVTASQKLEGPKPAIKGDRTKFIEQIRQALYASKIVSYAQGYMLMRAVRQGIWLELKLRRHRVDVARRLYHPQPFPRRH